MLDLAAGLERLQRRLDQVDRHREADARALLSAAVGGDLVDDPDDVPFASSTGPPELPGFMAASVWIACATVKPFGAWIVRSTPETMPVLMLRA